MSFGDGCFEDAPRYADLERPDYPDLRLAVWALLKRLEAIQDAACTERGNDPLINNCRHALNGWTPHTPNARSQALREKGVCNAETR